MSAFELTAEDYPRTVAIHRPGGEFDTTGIFIDETTVLIPSMPADIQQSLKIRNHLSEDSTGVSDNVVWLMFCQPPVPLREGDLVIDTGLTFVIDSVGDWGTHTECIMRIL
jgi:hypothetical protein